MKRCESDVYAWSCLCYEVFVSEFLWSECCRFSLEASHFMNTIEIVLLHSKLVMAIAHLVHLQNMLVGRIGGLTEVPIQECIVSSEFG
jgi:hypothetical protein